LYFSKLSLRKLLLSHKIANMKKIIALLLLTAGLIINVSAQKKTFLRIYDLSGKKIAKGYFAGTTDSTLVLVRDNQLVTVPVHQINTIRTKRSAGHTIGVTAAVCTGVFTIALLAGSGGDSWFSYSASDAIGAGIITGTVGGIVIGGIASAAKNPKLLTVNGNMENWEKVKAELDKLAVYKIAVSN
jgi:hypothetical protein